LRRRGQVGRLLCEVLLPNGEDVSLDQVKGGFTPNFSRSPMAAFSAASSHASSFFSVAAVRTSVLRAALLERRHGPPPRRYARACRLVSDGSTSLPLPERLKSLLNDFQSRKNERRQERIWARMLGLGYLRRAAPSGNVSFVLNVAVLLLLSTAEVSAQTGKIDYQNYCASCHGIDGEGGKEVDIPGPALTHLSQKYGGTFPFQEVYEVIDGRKKAEEHERLLSMPLWGVYFQPQGVSKGVSEAKVKSRIADLVRYIQSLQER